MNENEQLDYMAGYFDANGCVTGKNDAREGPLLWCNVTTIHTRITDLYKSIFGGYVTVIARPDKQYASRLIQSTRETFQWRVEHRKAVAFAAAVHEHAQLKRPQLDILLAMQTLRGDGHRVSPSNKAARLELLNKLRLLNKGLYADSGQTISDNLSIPYIAGYFDGDGCITGQVQDNTAGAKCSTSSIDLELLNILHLRYGGSVAKIFDAASNDGSRVGIHDSFSWQLSLNQSVPFVSEILPYLLLKQTQARALLEMASLRHDRKLGTKMPDETRARRFELLSIIKAANQNKQ